MWVICRNNKNRYFVCLGWGRDMFVDPCVQTGRVLLKLHDNLKVYYIHSFSHAVYACFWKFIFLVLMFRFLFTFLLLGNIYSINEMASGFIFISNIEMNLNGFFLFAHYISRILKRLSCPSPPLWSVRFINETTWKLKQVCKKKVVFQQNIR